LHHAGFQNTFAPSKSLPAHDSEVSGDGLESFLTLPMDFSWEMLSEAHRILSDYRKLPNIERWYHLETEVQQASARAALGNVVQAKVESSN
jgi:hypothetical protein